MHQDGAKVMQIVRGTGLGWAAVRTALDLHTTAGPAALLPAQRGRKAGFGRRLTARQEAAVRLRIRARPPVQNGRQGGLWSRAAVGGLLTEKFGITITDRAIGHYLERWGLALATRGRPADRCVPAIREWLREHYAELERLARMEGAEVFWLNKPVRLDAAWSRSGEESLQPAEPASECKPRDRRSMASATSSQGRLVWRVYRGAFNEAQQRKFLSALVRDAPRRPIFLIRYDMKTYTEGFSPWSKWVTRATFPAMGMAAPRLVASTTFGVAR